MPFTLTMPKLSPTMEQGTITQWQKHEGDFVGVGETLLEVATDKATVEYQAFDEGWLKKIIVAEGEEAFVNQAIAIFTEEKDESIEGYHPEGKDSARKEDVPVEENLSQEKEKPAFVDQPAVTMRQAEFVPEPPLERDDFSSQRVSTGRVFASPLARRVSKERDLDLNTVKGTGPSGRIMNRDLVHAQADTAVAFGRREVPKYAPGEYEEKKLTPMRKTIGGRLRDSKMFIPHYYVTQKINAAALVETREQLKAMGVKVTFNDFVIRAAALALREHKEINTGYHSVHDTIVQFKTVDIAVAVSFEGGLITPIIRYADFKNLGQISVEVRNLVKKAREGKLEPKEYRGGSFTISNLGMYGISEFTAIINPPQSAILAVGSIEDVPVVKDGLVVPGKVLKFTLSSDHRIIDGAEAANFLKTIRKYLENPASLLLN